MASKRIEKLIELFLQKQLRSSNLSVILFLVAAD